MRSRSLVAAGLAVTLFTLLGQTAASAGGDPASQFASQVVEPPVSKADDAVRVAVTRDGDTLTAKADSLQVTVTPQGAGRVALSRPGSTSGSLSVGLPTGGNGSKAAVAKNGTITYNGALPGVDVTVETFDHSVRVQTVISTAQAAQEYVYPVDVPKDGALKVETDGSVSVTAADGLLVGGMAPPWAKDASGKDVATHYEVRGREVVQVVEHAAAAHPVVADPWLWIDLIDHAVWRYDARHGWTLMVTPTTWARVNAGGYLVGVAGWNELYDKYKNRGLNTNLDGMRDQFICHEQVVAIRSPRKPTWNLDEWRPNVSYLATVNAQCNPGGPSIFD